jgi:hypothetical protein
MLVEQLFVRVGISTRFGKTRVRFTNNMTREIILVKDGHDDIKFFDLPTPMTKPEAVTFIVERKDEFADMKDKIAIDEANDRYNTVIVTGGSKAQIAAPSLADLKDRAKEAIEA